MQVVDNKYLVLKPENPQHVLNTIEKSAEYGDDGEVAVYWGLKEAQMLKQLGIECPSPDRKSTRLNSSH